MKKLNKFILVIFSIIILIIGVAINLIMVGWLDFDVFYTLLENMLTQEPADQIILIITEFCMLFAIIAIFTDTPEKKEPKGGKDILMQNDNGKLMISRDTIENLVNSVVRKFEGAREANTKIQFDAENNLLVLVDLAVTKDVVIKELTVNMQSKIKEEIKKTSDLEVKEVDVRIRNISEPETANKKQ